MKAAAPRASRSAKLEDSPPSTRTRDREATRERILVAVGEVLARDGFTGLGINAVAREAGVDKVLIYRYFGGLPELLRTWGESGRFWPSVSDFLADVPDALSLPADQRWSRFLEHFIASLRARPLTLEILAAEVHERNELTAILEAQREAWGEEASSLLGGAAFASRPWMQELTVLLIGGIQYLLVRARRLQHFGGIDLQADEGWARVSAALKTVGVRVLADPAR